MIQEKLVSYFDNSIRENWNKTALRDYDNGEISYAKTGNTILKLHDVFRRSGIVEGDKIAVIGKNSANWACVYIAAVSYGAVIVPLLQDFTAKEVYNLVNHSESKLLFASDFIFNKLNLQEFTLLKSIYQLDNFELLFDADQKSIRFNNALPEVSQADFALHIPENSLLAAILYTSGTSGNPKGVMLAHNALAANIRYARANMPLQPGDRIVSFLPLAHSYGCAFEFLYPFSIGCTITFLGRLPAPNIVVKAFNEIKPRLILSVPLVIEKVYKTKIKPKLSKPGIKLMLKIPGLRQIVYRKIRAGLSASFGNEFMEVVIGGAKLNREVEIFLRKINFNFSIGYGMTECGPLITYDGWKTTRTFSAGKVIDCLEMKIDSDNPSKRVGEILLRGENVMLGYYKNKDETEKTFTEDGWMKTGDLGLIDEDGYLYIKGRSKSMILGASGKNIYPEEVEAKLQNLPLVSECIVVGRQNQIVAMVYPDHAIIEERALNKEQLETIFSNYQKLVNKDLPGYMQIQKIVLREEEFEKTPKKSIKRYLYE
ncbi:MAG: AMP-binding protein [Bacteroidales bacterium]|nr:AMP-binding protein [Bacteroidales bacterium]HQP04302.1 AMP-binding protein [Bacteroidales bacterium]